MTETERKSQLAIIFVTVFIYLLGFGIVIPLLPLLSQEFGASALETGLLLSMYSLMQFTFAPLWGKLSDRLGRRKILLGCLLGEALTYILFAHATNLTMLFIARGLAGFFGASLSTASAAISDITPPQHRSKGMALIGAAFGLGFLFGPALGGLLSIWGQSLSNEPGFSTRFTMYWVAGLCLLTFAVGFRLLKETLPAQDQIHKKPSRWALLTSNFTRPVVGPLMGVFFLSSFAMSAMEMNLVLYMKDRFSWGIREVSFGFAYIGIIMVLTQGVLVRRLLPKMGERIVLRTGLILFSIGLLGVALAPSIPIMAAAMTALALGNGLSNPSILGSISLLTSGSEQGATMGSTQSLASLGRILGPAFGGFLYERLFPQAPFATGSLLGFTALTIVLILGAQIPASARQEASP